MTKQQYLDLKSELKILATQIKFTKLNYKKSQKTLAYFKNVNGSFDDYYKREINSTKWELIRDEHSKLSSERDRLLNLLVSTQDDFRLMHMVYCLLFCKRKDKTTN